MRKIYVLFMAVCCAMAVQAQTSLSKREVMNRFLNGTLDKSYVPAAFFMHFDKNSKVGEGAVNSHIKYFVSSGMDFVKVQFEQGYGRRTIEKAEDWEQIQPFDVSFFQPTLDVVKGVYDIAGHEAMVLPTVYSPFQMLIQTVGAPTVVKYAKEDPTRVTKALDIFTNAIIQYVQACKKIGVDGFYTPTQGGETKFYDTPGFFEKFVKPYDLRVMNECNKGTKLNILHICDYEGTYDELKRFADYPGQIVNTPNVVNGQPFSLQDGEKLFKRIAMGGLDRKGIIVNGTAAEVKAEVEKVKKNHPQRFILGAECTIRPTTPVENIRTAIGTAHGSK